jgi:hypothetical protein
MSIHLAILRAAGWLVPHDQRTEWLAEWQAEVWYISRGDQGKATAFCLGAFRDAFWLRRNSLPDAMPAFPPASPYFCLAALAGIAAALVLLAYVVPVPDGAHLPHPPTPRATVIAGAFEFAAVLTIVVLGVGVARRGLERLQNALDRGGMVTLDLHLPPLPLKESRTSRYAPRGAARMGRWAFCLVKSALVAVIAVFISLDTGAAGAIGIVFSYVVVFRWAVADQRNRCPVCLRRLTNPTRIGEPSHTFLDWYGTELVCARGHGLLHVPEFRASCYNTERWLYLDPSWSSLFFRRA